MSAGEAAAPQSPLRIRPYEPVDWKGVWAILEPVFRAGETYAFSTDVTEVAARRDWTGPPKTVFVATSTMGS